VCKGAAHSRPCTFTDPTIVVDVREKLPYEFPGSVTQFLHAGDYSILGRENSVAVERKSKSDAFRSLGYARERFRREFERLADLDYSVVLVECTVPQFLIPSPFSELRPETALKTLLSWSVRYGVGLLFVGDREQGQWITQYLLTRFAWYASQGEADDR
jgi:ERCC4-type nuclease